MLAVHGRPGRPGIRNAGHLGSLVDGIAGTTGRPRVNVHAPPVGTRVGNGLSVGATGTLRFGGHGFPRRSSIRESLAGMGRKGMAGRGDRVNVDGIPRGTDIAHDTARVLSPGVARWLWCSAGHFFARDRLPGGARIGDAGTLIAGILGSAGRSSVNVHRVPRRTNIADGLTIIGRLLAVNGAVRGTGIRDSSVGVRRLGFPGDRLPRGSSVRHWLVAAGVIEASLAVILGSVATSIERRRSFSIDRVERGHVRVVLLVIVHGFGALVLEGVKVRTGIALVVAVVRKGTGERCDRASRQRLGLEAIDIVARAGKEESGGGKKLHCVYFFIFYYWYCKKVKSRIE